MDGSETHEAISLMIAIKKVGMEYTCFAINENQKYVIHTTGMSQSNEKRNILTEAGRLNHGMVYDLNKLHVEQFDGLVFPGGYGTGTSYSNFIICDGKTCQKNADYVVRDEIKAVIQEFHEKQKPIFAGCMAPVLVNGSLTGIKIMIDEGMYTKEIIEKHNNTYQVCNINEICVDEDNKIITAPYYMAKRADVFTVFTESVKAMEEMVKII